MEHDRVEIEGVPSRVQTSSVAQEILVDLSSDPDGGEFARNSHQYRPRSASDYENLGSSYAARVPYDERKRGAR